MHNGGGDVLSHFYDWYPRVFRKVLSDLESRTDGKAARKGDKMRCWTASSTHHRRRLNTTILTIVADELLSWEYRVLTHWGYRIGLYLFDLMACRMVNARPLPHSLKPPRTNFKEYWTKYVEFRFENSIESVVCRPHCVKISVHLYESTLTRCSL